MPTIDVNDPTLPRRAVLQGIAALGAALAAGPRAFAAEALAGDELPLVTTGLEHIGMVVPDVEAAARFYSSLFEPEMQKEKDAPLRYYVMTGTGYIAIGSRPNVTASRVDHYCTLVRGYDRDKMNATLAKRGMPAAARGVVPDPDGIGLQLIAVPGGPGPTAVPGGHLVSTAPLVKPVGFDSIELAVADVARSAAFYEHFFRPATGAANGTRAFQAADTRIVLQPVAAGRTPGVERFVMRVAPFDRAAVIRGLRSLGATVDESRGAEALRFQDPNGLGVALVARGGRP